MHSLFGAMRLYVVSVHRIERDLPPPDDGFLPPIGEGAWALWARMGEGRGLVDPLPPVSRVAGAVHIAAARRLRP